MVHIKFLVTLLLTFGLVAPSFAAFQSMRPPPGYSKTGQQPGWGPTYKPAAGEFYDLDKQQWMTVAKASAGGKELSVPSALPIGTPVNVALAVATAFSTNPAILLGTAAWALYQAYLAQKNITPNNDGTFTEGVLPPDSCLTNCREYRASPAVVWSNTAAGAAQQWCVAKSQTGGFNYVFVSFASGVLTYRLVEKSGPYNQQWTNSGLPMEVRPRAADVPTPLTLTPQQVSDKVASLPMSKPLIDALPMPLPVKSPVLNPSPTGQPQVLRVPQGSPQPQPLPSPNPENLPQTWKTPVVDLIPSPTPDDPWRVEVIPKDVVKTSPTPLPDPFNPNPVPVTPPVPVNDPDAAVLPSEQTPGLCDLYPDILACAKPVLDTPETPTLETKPRELTYTPDAGWGSGGACPAPRHLPGANVDFEFTLVCDFMTGIKPVLLTVASLLAGMIIIGARGGAAD